MLEPVKITEIKSVGVKPVYDLCVPGPHHYILESGIVSHNSGFIFASSIVVAMKKLKLKEDEDGNKIGDVRGIRAACKVVKTRYAKPFESVQVKIPYDTGMNPHSGLVDLFEKKGVLEKTGNKLLYIDLNGEEIKKFRKQWERNDDGCLNKVMEEFAEKIKPIEEQAIEDEEEAEYSDEVNSSNDDSTET